MVGQLEEIDSLINHDHFNKAFVRIDEVDTASLNQEEYAHYNLLVAQRCCIKRQRDTTGLLDKIVIPYYLSTNNHEKLAEGYYYQAFGRLLSNQLSQAVVLYKKAEEQAAKTNNDRLHYKIAQSLSYVNEVCGNHLLQLNYAKQALAIALATGKEKWLAYSYTRVAMAHSELQHEDSAITYMRQALPYSHHMEKEDLPAFLNNVAFTFKYSQPDSAKKYLWESLALQEHSNTLQHLADIYYEEGEQPILGMTCFAETRVKVFDREHMCIRYITVPPNTIIIDNSVMAPGKETLANFTVLHEGGHFCMHREVFEDGMRRNCPPEFCSRKKSGQSRKRLESQKDFREHHADVFAAAVALPADTLVPCATRMIRCMGFPDGVFVTGHKYDRNKKPGLDRLIGNLAETCGVSRSAVKIRLQRLGLLQDRLEYGRDILIIL